MDALFAILLWLGNFLATILEFGLKACIVLIVFALCAKILKNLNPAPFQKKKLKVENLKEKYEKYKKDFYKSSMSPTAFNEYLKSSEGPKKKGLWSRWFKKGSAETKDPESEKTKSKSLKPENPCPTSLKTEDPSQKSSLFVLSFKGDIMATELKNLREEISIILNLAKEKDSVMLILESRGGSVSHYGLAANQLQRLRDKNIPLTVCVDKVAGSGGYLMACVANQILASPFAFIGSIGVMYGIPNVHELLKKYDVSYEEFTAGKYKRTVTPLGKITEEKKTRLQEQLNLVHSQFKNFVQQYRKLDLEEVATGEAWLAEEALKKGLVDKIQCSDDYILDKIKTHNVYKLRLKKPLSPLEKLFKKKPLGALGGLSEDLLHQDIIL